MKTHAHHDRSGRIASLVVFNGPEGSGLMMRPKPGLLVAEIADLPEMNPRNVDALRTFAQEHTVVIQPARLTAKQKK